MDLKTIPGFPDHKMAKNDNRVWLKPRFVQSKWLSISKSEGRWIEPYLHNSGYLMITLSKDGKYYTKKIHRLKGITFIDNPEDKCCINHKNGIKTDNDVDNLEWVTYKEHAQHHKMFHSYKNIEKGKKYIM